MYSEAIEMVYNMIFTRQATSFLGVINEPCCHQLKCLVTLYIFYIGAKPHIDFCLCKLMLPGVFFIYIN